MNRIKELRRLKGIKQLDIAKLLKVSQQTVSTYENGTRDPDTDSIKILADYYEVSIGYLLGQTDIESRYEDAEFFLTKLRERLIMGGYDFNDKSAEEIADIIIMALEFVDKIRE